MPVPASYNEIVQDDIVRRHVGWVWYERPLVTPPLPPATRLVLRFHGATYNSQVWINGQDVMSHSGGHLPFEAEITKFLVASGTNRLTVAVNNTLSAISLPPGEVVTYNNDPRYPNGWTVQHTDFGSSLPSASARLFCCLH
jgi:beta-glucuronidase